MNAHNATQDTPANQLCKACGLCCNGQLFIWVKLRPSELDPAEALGMTVFRNDPTQRGFSQPCPLWQATCTIYTSRHYPHACRAYKCQLLKEVISETTQLQDALEKIAQTKAIIRDLQKMLPESNHPNFRERLVAEIEHPGPASTPQFLQKAQQLLHIYEEIFGVKDLLENQSANEDKQIPHRTQP